MNKKIFAIIMMIAVSENVSSEVKINGFANFIGGITSSDDTLYGYDDNISFSPESLFAVQLSSQINDKMTATAQLVSRGSEDYSVDFEWAYLSYQATDNIRLSAGRVRMPIFRYSDSLDVGYSYHWVVAPANVYDVPYNNIDGIKFDYSGYSGDLEYIFQLTGGKINSDFSLGGAQGNMVVNSVIVSALDLTYLNWNVRGVAARGSVTFDFPALAPFFGQLDQIDPTFTNLLAAEDDTGEFYGISIEYDAFSWFIGAEMTSVLIEDSFYPDELNYYVTAGMRLNKCTPFITYEKADLNDGPKFLDRISAYPVEAQGPLSQLVPGIQSPAIRESNTTSIGVRYDLDTNIALKADISMFKDDISDDDATALRFAVNYIF